MAQTPLGDMAESLALLKQNQQQPPHAQQQQIPDHMNPLSLMQAISNAQRNQGSSQPQTSREMSLPAGLVAALVARNKLAEIRGVIRYCDFVAFTLRSTQGYYYPTNLC